MTAPAIIALSCVALAWMWTAHLRRKQERERRAQLEAAIAQAEADLQRSLEHDKGNIYEHQRLRARWLSLLAER